jgi:D-3-phosphoglycerate dehydrogenase
MSSKPKILVYAPREEPPDILQALEAKGYDLVIGDKQWQVPRGDHEDALVAAARDSVALMGTSIRATPISRRVMEASQRLRVIAKYTVGVDDVDTEAATELGIMVCHSPTEDNCFAVAENTMALMLAILKKVQTRDADIRAGKWRMPHHAGTFLGSRDSDGYPGITIGIVGLGRVGTRFAQLLAPWRVRLIAYDPHVEPMRFLLTGVKSVDYETLLRESDVISYHVVLTKETRYMCGPKEIGMMKKNAVVLNTARGKVVDEDALAIAIREGRIQAAAIDAFVEEPPAPDSMLRSLGDKLLMSPHAVAFNGNGELREGVDWAARSVHTALSGKIPDNVYNKDVLMKWKERFGDVSVLPG